MLRKRKTPLHALFAEREALRNTPLKKMETLTIIPISGISLNKVVKIDNHSYEYKGQQTVKRSGIKKTVYLFKGISTEVDKEFVVTQAPTFKLVHGILVKN